MASSKKDAKSAKTEAKPSSPRSQGSTTKTTATAKPTAKPASKAPPAALKPTPTTPAAAGGLTGAAKAIVASKTKTPAPKPGPESLTSEAVKVPAAILSAKPSVQRVAAKASVADIDGKTVKSGAIEKTPAAPAKSDKNAKIQAPVKTKSDPQSPVAKSAAPAKASQEKAGGTAGIAPSRAAVGVKGKTSANTGAIIGSLDGVKSETDDGAEASPRPIRVTPAKSQEKTTPAKSPEPVAASPSPAGVKSTADAKPVAPPVAKPRPAAAKLGFKLNEFIVYPAHGVGQITSVEIQEVAGFSLELYVVSFIKDKMILKVPTSKVSTVGMRKLAETNIVEKALSTLSGRARIKRTMWSRRAQEYEAKINSGDLVTIAEVVRDLYRSDTQPEQSYSERQLYEAALDRMAREIAAVRRLIDAEALKLIESFLQKGPKRGLKSDSEGDADDGADEGIDDDTDVDAAA